jgi:predicted RNase H-like HicB family nuclease
VEVPDLQGCISEGATLAEAILMGTDAASGWVLDELEDGRPAPRASAIKDLSPEEGGFISMLVLDMAAYAEKYGKNAVEKNLAIPAWLNTYTEARHINCAKVLQNALMEIYQREHTSG